MKKDFKKIKSADRLESHPMRMSDLPFWREMYSDDRVKLEMYSIPRQTDEEMFNYFNKEGVAKAFTVTLSDISVGGFTIQKENPTLGSFGFIVHKDHRGIGLGAKIIEIVQIRAKEMGLHTLRADVYADNKESISVLAKAGFRTFIWLEKNLEWQGETIDEATSEIIAVAGSLIELYKEEGLNIPLENIKEKSVNFDYKFAFVEISQTSWEIPKQVRDDNLEV